MLSQVRQQAQQQSTFGQMSSVLGNLGIGGGGGGGTSAGGGDADGERSGSSSGGGR